MKFLNSLYVALCVGIWAQADAQGWAEMFHRIDANRDNVLSDADGQRMSQVFTDLHQMDYAKKQVFSSEIEALWKSCIMGDKSTITEQQFVDSYHQYEAAAPDELKTYLTDCFYSSFVLADTNNDVHISENEYVILAKAYGAENEEEIKSEYQSASPNNDGISLAKAVSMITGYE